MDAAIVFLRFVHLLGVAFMAWPLYALIAMNEHGRLGPPLGDRADHYMESIVSGAWPGWGRCQSWKSGPGDRIREGVQAMR